MSRAAPLLAAISLSTGCLFEADPPAGDVDIYWTFQSPTLGDIGDVLTDDATTICTEAAVDDVKISLWLADPPGVIYEPSTGPCIPRNDVPGTAFRDLQPGTWEYVLEARRGGVTVFEVAGDFEIRAGEATIEDARAPPVVGNWDVAVTYTTGACAPGDRMKFDLVAWATLDTVFSTDDARVNPRVTIPCEHTLPYVIPSVAPGAYRFSDWVHLDATGTVEKAYSTCRPSWTQSDAASSEVSVVVTAVAADPTVCP